MKIKKIVSLVLGIFVLVSIAFLVVGELKKKDEIKNTNFVGTQVNKISVTESIETAKKTIIQTKKIDGLYFHGTNRCKTCNLMEGYIRDVLEKSFEKEMKSGLLTFESVNVEEPNRCV